MKRIAISAVLFSALVPSAMPIAAAQAAPAPSAAKHNYCERYATVETAGQVIEFYECYYLGGGVY